MIPNTYITEWSAFCPWQEPKQVEQDLVITKALIEIYSNAELFNALAFRGGTALNKLYFKPASRYSEDIDLVQTNSEPIGETITLLRSILDPWLGDPKRLFSEGRVTLAYRFLSEENFPLKLKVEINSREHFTELGFKTIMHSCNSSWYTGIAPIKTYALEEMLGTKMRALYQRRKGRDLYDLYMSLNCFSTLDYNSIIKCFHRYMEFVGKTVSQEVFDENMHLKLCNEDFRNDIFPLLAQKDIPYNVDSAYKIVYEKLISIIDTIKS